MSKSNLKTGFLLSIIITALAAFASAGGLLLNDLYRDNDFVRSAWYTNDIITLFVVVPSMVISMILFKKGFQRWLFIWLGLLGYMVYNFAFYLFGAVFNNFFLVYTALFSLSGITLILMLSRLQSGIIAQKFARKAPVKLISIYLLVIAVMLFTIEISMIIPFILSGTVPETIKLTAHPTSVVFAQDLSIIVPASVMAAIYLWKRSSWGYVMAIIMLVKGFTYGLVLSIGTALLAYSDIYGKWDPLMPLYITITLGGILGCWLLLKNFDEGISTDKNLVRSI